MFVPQDGGLIDMVWRSKMDVGLSDLGGFPRCFSVAWPSGTVVDGVGLRGCLVWFGRHKERDEVMSMMERWMGKVEEVRVGHRVPSDDYELHVSYPDGEGLSKWYVRASMPHEWLEDCLKSEGDLKNRLGNYASPMSIELDEDEVHKQYVTLRCVVNLMVYASACPEAVVEGWPGGVSPGGPAKGKSPLFLKSPLQRVSRGGSHASPEPHFRNPHFRRYPIRNGERRKGIVFVSGCMVNAEMEPKTVK